MSGFALPSRLIGEIHPLRRLDAGKVPHTNTVLASKPDRRGCRLAVCPKRCRDRWPREGLLQRRLLIRQLCDPDGQPPGRAESLDAALPGQTGLAQPRRDALADLPRQRRQPAGRQLFTADFQKELSIHINYGQYGQRGGWSKWVSSRA